jgi:threonine synthase
VKRLMDGLTQSRAFAIADEPLAAIRARFGAGRTDEDATGETIRRTDRLAGYLLDPHTAVGVAVAERQAAGTVPMVVLGTAHPAKFPDAVEAAAGRRPGLPAWLSDLMTRPERQSVVPNSLDAVEAFVLDRARAVTTEA